MSSITRAQALLISHANVLGSYVQSNNTDQLLPRIPKMPIVGDALQVAAVDALATAAFIISGGTADASATTYEASARSFPLRRIAAKVEVNGDIAQNVSEINDVFEQQIQAKMIAIWNEVGDQPDQRPRHRPRSVRSGHACGREPQRRRRRRRLDAHACRPRRGDDVGAALGRDTPRAFVVNRGQYARITGLLYTAGATPQFMPDRLLGESVLHYMGIPVLVSDWITNTESTDKTSVYLVILGPREGDPQYGGLVWGYNQQTGPGIRVDGPHRTSGTTDLLFATLELNIAFASLSTGSVARIMNIDP